MCACTEYPTASKHKSLRFLLIFVFRPSRCVDDISIIECARMGMVCGKYSGAEI